MAINTTNATMQMRRGNEADFDPDKMSPGEWSVSLDKKYVRMCFLPGLCIRMATYEGFEEDMKEIQDILEECQDIQTAVQNFVKLAETHSKEAESWAHGQTGIREGEDTDNSKYYSEQAELAKEAAEEARDQAQAATGIVIATTERIGVVKPDGTTITIDPDGTIHASGGADVDIATTEKVGVVKPDGVSAKVKPDGTLSVPGGKPDFYGAYADFPDVGDPDILYIDNTVNPRLMYTWDQESSTYILTGGADGAGGSSIDIPLTLLSTGWTGTEAPYSQTVTVPQMREGMTPLYFFNGIGDNAIYAFSLITGYDTGYAQITFYAADEPEVDIPLVLKGIPSQQLEYADNSVVVVVPANFTLDTNYNRYVQTIPVEGMVSGAQGGWDMVRSGEILTPEESNIAASITDVIPMDGAVKIVCLWPPEQQYMLKLVGTYTQVTEGTTLLAGMQGWFDRVEALEHNNIDSPVSLNTYTQDFYKTLTDGYLKIYAINGKIQVNIYGSDSDDNPTTLALYSSGESQQNSVFIKAGMRLKVISRGNNCNSFFYPLI